MSADAQQALAALLSASARASSAFWAALPAPSASPAAPPAPAAASEGLSAADLRRAESASRSMLETNERVIAQNIALLGEVETLRQALVEMRNEKLALAVQLRHALARQA